MNSGDLNTKKELKNKISYDRLVKAGIQYQEAIFA